MFARLGQRLTAVGRTIVQRLTHRLMVATKPNAMPLVVGTLADLPRSKPALIAENALLRHQLAILRRGVKRPRCTPMDRALLVLLASRVRAWRQALVIVQPDTLLRWHRHLFRLVWRRRSQPSRRPRKPRVSPETIALIQEMACANRTWGAERIRGELLKLDIRVAKWTVQKYMRTVRPSQPSGQTWATFLHNHAADIWACDLLPVTDLLFRPLYAFFIVGLASRRVMHVEVTRIPRMRGWPNSCARPRPSGSIPAFSSGTMTPRMGRPSRALLRPAASRSCGPPIGRPKRTPCASASSARCAANAWLTCSSWARHICGASCALMRRTSTRSDRIRGSANGSQRQPWQQREAGVASVWSQSWAGSIMPTAAPRKSQPRADTPTSQYRDHYPRPCPCLRRYLRRIRGVPGSDTSIHERNTHLPPQWLQQRLYLHRSGLHRSGPFPRRLISRSNSPGLPYPA